MSSVLRPYPFEYVRRASQRRGVGAREEHPVVIVGGGIAGLTAALGLARHGIRCAVIEADDTVCYGSRAICFSRRSLEIFARYGVAEPMLAKGLAWTGGRSFHRDEQVFHFTMPHDAEQTLPPMINLQQYYVEEYLVRALETERDLVEIHWGSKVVSAVTRTASVDLEVEGPSGRYTVSAAFVIASDGGRSVMREHLGLPLQGTAYEGRYIVADILLKSKRPTERLAWFDPPSNPGSTILMHKQPDDIWRIDYQLRDDEDPEEAVKPENVLPRVRAHLEMIGEPSSWEPLWITIYKANALTLERYRHDRVLFAGDAAHLVPIFGVRGANSSIDDADNLAWKLAHVIRGDAGLELLDSYSEERRFAADENLRNGMKSTEFMAPPSLGFRLMREAVLDLARDTPGVRPLINPRQTTAITYRTSPLNAAVVEEDRFAGGPPPGAVLPRLTELVQPGTFLLLHFRDHEEPSAAIEIRSPNVRVRSVSITRRADGHHDRLFTAFDASPEAVYLVRPDGHVCGRWRTADRAVVEAALATALGRRR